MVFKIVLPTGYQINDILNDNLDVHVVLESREVFFATLFTTNNVQMLMSKQDDCYFWATDMIIVKDLQKDTIKTAVAQIMADGYLDKAFTLIGNLDTVYGSGSSFERLEGI